MEIVWINIDELSPAEYNPRAISEESMNGLRASIRTFKMPQPIVVNHRSDGRKVITGGHQRYEAAKLEGWEKVPCILMKLSMSQEKALNVTLNNKSIEGYFTADLQDILKELSTDLTEELFGNLRLDTLVTGDWQTDFDPDSIGGDKDPLKKATIFIDCPPDDKDAILIYIKDKLMETSFEGVHVR